MRARDRFEQYAFGVAHSIGAQQICAAGPMLPGAPGAVLEDRGELCLHLVQIADRVFVEDYHVGAEPLQPPVFLRLKDLPYQQHIFVSDHADQQDGQVA